MKKYITIAGAVLLGNVAAQAEDIEVEAAPYYNPLAKTEYQLKEQAYLEALQKIYGTSVQSGNPLSDLEREMKQQTYLSGMQNIYGHYNVQSPKVQGGDPLSDVEREMKQQAYLSGMQNIYGHYANVQSPQWGYYDPLYLQQHQLKQQAYLETMQKIYGNKVQQGNPLEDVEREMKQQAYLSGMQNIYGHYNVQAPNPYYDPLYQQKHQLKEQAYLETMQKIYGPSVQDNFDDIWDKSSASYEGTFNYRQQMKSQQKLNQIRKQYGGNVEVRASRKEAMADFKKKMALQDKLDNLQSEYGPDYDEEDNYDIQKDIDHGFLANLRHTLDAGQQIQDGTFRKANYIHKAQPQVQSPYGFGKINDSVDPYVQWWNPFAEILSWFEPKKSKPTSKPKINPKPKPTVDPNAGEKAMLKEIYGSAAYDNAFNPKPRPSNEEFYAKQQAKNADLFKIAAKRIKDNDYEN
ncbi:UNKNOWN [Stylonychia lemnae]|uniref:Uncharacterized protein n=1 Tax=Stylonychia lemnae TaxID=5949 RepID=A0A078A7A7_STYLE|nr:UNKNOWN [Stylonychia lemnae]|eukprot:CDW78135.1 UNKNOWN [Stylonychia lemnae]